MTARVRMACWRDGVAGRRRLPLCDPPRTCRFSATSYDKRVLLRTFVLVHKTRIDSPHNPVRHGWTILPLEVVPIPHLQPSCTLSANHSLHCVLLRWYCFASGTQVYTSHPTCGARRSKHPPTTAAHRLLLSCRRSTIHHASSSLPCCMTINAASRTRLHRLPVRTVKLDATSGALRWVRTTWIVDSRGGRTASLSHHQYRGRQRARRKPVASARPRWDRHLRRLSRRRDAQRGCFSPLIYNLAFSSRLLAYCHYGVPPSVTLASFLGRWAVYTAFSQLSLRYYPHNHPLLPAQASQTTFPNTRYSFPFIALSSINMLSAFLPCPRY